MIPQELKLSSRRLGFRLIISPRKRVIIWAGVQRGESEYALVIARTTGAARHMWGGAE